ncbi:MAG UNVERIFIED_CONTAM: nucleotidyltransferase substrate binding protein [Planctomycetaceae bacterium]|jgi:nucleotidyltransferase substrate binding protein (TIGR01987 family)
MQEKLVQKFTYLEKALLQLEIIINDKVTAHRAEIDASIQRFEFCFELFWKTLKLILEIQGISCSFPKEVLKSAYQGKLIDDEKIWLNMLHDRNKTSHIYDEQEADRIYGEIKNIYFNTLNISFQKIKHYSKTL